MAWSEIIGAVVESISLPLSYFISPQKRVCLIYLASSVLLAGWVYRNSRFDKTFLEYLFPKKVWLSDSAWVDYGLFLFNGFVKVLCILPYWIYGMHIAFWVNEFLKEVFGTVSLDLSPGEVLFYYTFVLVVFGDFATYVVHYLMHRVSFLWRFHKVHHSATTLNPITQYRIHPVELIINNLRGMIVFGATTGLLRYLSQHPIDIVDFLGVNIFAFLFFLMGANLRHSHVKLRYWDFMESILISPFQHQIHHSEDPKYHYKNFGGKLAIWDWLFGTLVKSNACSKIKFGLGAENGRYDSLTKNLLVPLGGSRFRTK